MARVALPQSRIRARRRRRRILVAYIVGAVALIVLIALVWLAHAPFLRITAVAVSGESTLNAGDISNLVLGDIGGSYLYLFPKNNVFLYPKHQTQLDLAKQMPAIAQVTISAKDFHTLQVTVTERARKALWCGNTAAEEGVGACFWLDQNGAAYEAATDLSPADLSASSTYERYYGVLTGQEPQQFTTPAQFQALSALIDALSQNQPDNPVQSIEADEAGDVTVTFADNFMLMFSLSSAGADVYQRFLLALGSDAFAGHSLSDFEYLDLRFGDKLYYKLRDNLTPVINTTAQ